MKIPLAYVVEKKHLFSRGLPRARPYFLSLNLGSVPAIMLKLINILIFNFFISRVPRGQKDQIGSFHGSAPHIVDWIPDNFLTLTWSP